MHHVLPGTSSCHSKYSVQVPSHTVHPACRSASLKGSAESLQMALLHNAWHARIAAHVNARMKQTNTL